MKQILIILGLFASITTFAQSPRIKLNQITKDTVKGSVLISSPSDSGMVYSRDFYVAYGADTVLILYGDTLAATSGIISSVLSDGVTITGNGTIGNELKVDTLLISTIKALNDTLTNRGYLSVAQLTDTLDANTRGFLTSEVDGSITNELQTISTSGAAGNITLSDGGGTLNLNVDDADASVSNEGSLTVEAGTASTSVISSNTSGSTDVTLTAGSNITLSETGNNITIAATGGGASYNNISENGDTLYVAKYLDVDTSTLYVDATNNRVGIGTSLPSAPLDVTVPNATAANEDLLAIYQSGGTGFFSISDGANGSNFLPQFSGKINGTFKEIGISFLAYVDSINDFNTGGPSYAPFMFSARRLMPDGSVEALVNSDVMSIDNYVTNLFKIQANGNVGIGTSSPQAPLSVAGSIHMLDVNQSSDTDNNLYIYNDDDAASSSGTTDASFGMYVAKKSSSSTTQGPVFLARGNAYTRVSNERGLLFFGAGKGMATPTGTDGNIWFNTNGGSMYLRYDGGLEVTNLLGSTSLTGLKQLYYNTSTKELSYDNTSSIKMKNNIMPYSRGLNDLLNVDVVEFNYKSDGTKDYGVIAEQLLEIGLDEFVYNNEDGEIQGVYKRHFTPLTIKAIQEQQAIIETIQTELDAKSLIIKTQQSEIDQLKTLITDLTNRLTILENK